MNKKMNGYLRVGLILTGFLAALILLGMFWTPYDPQAMSVGPKLAGPSLHHLIGTDKFGRDIFTRVAYGARISMTIGFSAAAINLIMPFVMVLGGIGFMIGTGGTALVSKVLGEGEPEKAKRYFTIWL